MWNASYSGLVNSVYSVIVFMCMFMPVYIFVLKSVPECVFMLYPLLYILLLCDNDVMCMI